LGHITKQGNNYLRALLVQAAWSVLRMKQDDPLKLWGQSVAKRRGNKVAAVAIARRLAGLLWAMWRDGTVYEAERLGQASGEGLERQAQSTQVVAAAIKRANWKTNRKVRAAKRMSAVN
jgi:transposase